MDSFRLFAGVVFAVSVFLLVDGYIREGQPKPAARSAIQQVHNTTTPIPSPGGVVPAKPAPNAAAPATSAQRAIGTGQRIKVETDTLAVEIDTLGGDLRRVELLHHKDPLAKSKNFVLLRDDPENLYVAQSGLGGGLPNHTTPFSAVSTHYKLNPGQDEVRVSLLAKTEQGAVEKIYTFTRGSYAIHESFQVTNEAKSAINPYAYFQFLRDSKPREGDSRMMPTF